ncbi:MAG: ABC transporter permease [Planctomycetaceae bacterium]
MAGFFQKHRNELGLVIATFVVLALTAAISPSYHSLATTQRTMESIGRETGVIGIMAIGAAIVIIAGGIDLSAGSVAAFSGMLFCGVIVLLAPDDPSAPWPQDSTRFLPSLSGLPLWIPLVALAVTLLAGLLVGTLHTWLITVIELPPFVATLASLVGLRSLARLLIEDMTVIRYGQEQSSITLEDRLLTSIGRGNWWVPGVIWMLLCIGMWVLLSRTIAGRHLYALGGNEQAARLSGIRTDRLKWLAYSISSVTAALSGVLLVCYVGGSRPSNDALGYELSAIAASVVGGCSLAGGVGTIVGVMLGTLFMRVVIDSVAKVFRSQPDLLEGLVVGVLVVLAVAFNELRGEGLKKSFFPGLFGWLNVGILSGLIGLVVAVTSQESHLRNGLIAGGGVLAVLLAKALSERVNGRASGSGG